MLGAGLPVDDGFSRPVLPVERVQFLNGIQLLPLLAVGVEHDEGESMLDS